MLSRTLAQATASGVRRVFFVERKIREVAAGEAALLRGNAPSAAEWRDAWAMLSETSCLRKCARARRAQFSAGDPTEGRIRKRRRKQP
eukprot:6764158-Pyramimonas_sp.AAC.1